MHLLPLPLFGLTALLACSTAPVESTDAPAATTPDVAPMQAVDPVEVADESAALTHPDPEVDALLDEVEAASAELVSLTARVIYTKTDELIGDTQQRAGNLTYLAPMEGSPTRFRVDFDALVLDGQPRRIDRRYVFDGVWLAEVNADDRQFTRYRLVEEGSTDDPFRFGDGPIPLPLGLRKADLLDRFDIEMARNPDEHGVAHNAYGLRLTPKPGHDIDARVITLWLDPGTYTPVSAEAEREESYDEVRLMSWELNGEVEAVAFDTQPPQGEDAAGWSIEVRDLE